MHEGCLEGGPDVYMLIQCTSLLVENAGVAPDMTLKFTMHMQASMQAREPSWLWNPWGGSHEVQNRGNHWRHKMDHGPTKIYFKEKDWKIFEKTKNILLME